MNLTCPCCFATISIETALESASGRELMGVLAQAGPMARPLAAYLGCFRSPSRALAWDRALKLAREVLSLADQGASIAPLQQALIETVEALRAKREAGDLRPLKNHNYLKRVLESVATVGAGLPVGAQHAAPLPATRRGGRSAMATAEVVLAEWVGVDWLRIEIAHGLLALLALPLYKSPEAGMVDRTASLWEMELRKGKIVLVESIDRPRIRQGFKSLLGVVNERFPEPVQIRDHLPRRPEQNRLEEPPLSAAERAAGVELLRQARERL